jgi:signal transduction histidine kinase
MIEDKDRDTFVNENLDDLFKLWMGRASLWGAIIFILLSGLDYVATPENFWLFLSYRIVISSVLIAVWLISWRCREKGILLHKVLGYIAVAGSAIAIELMILRFGGHASSYYTGLILLSVCVTAFIPARITFHAVCSLIIYAVYLLPILVTDEITDFKYFFTSNVFIIAVIGTSLLMRFLTERGLINELGLKYKIEEYHIDLEQMITERTWILKEAVEELENEILERINMGKQLENMIREKDEFISRLGHDLKTPLTPLVTLLPLIREQEKDPELMELLDVNIQNVNYMKELTVKTLQLARLTSSKVSPNREEIDLKEKAEEYINKRDDLIKRRGITTDNRIRPDIKILYDTMELEELFYNLITNAIKYSKEDSTITFDAETEGDLVTVSVRDTGIGLTEEQVGHVFDEFYKVDDSRHELDSSGLGLSICKKIVEKNGGRIWAESQGPGNGSTFYITLNLSHPEGEEKGTEDKQ